MMPPSDKVEETGFQSCSGRLLEKGGPGTGHRHLTGLQTGPDGSKSAPQESLSLWMVTRDVLGSLSQPEVPSCLIVSQSLNVWVEGTSEYPNTGSSSLGRTRCSGRGSSNGLFSLKKQRVQWKASSPREVSVRKSLCFCLHILLIPFTQIA